MKKICLLLGIVMILQMLCACNPKKKEFEKPINFYYGKWDIAYNTPNGVIQAETREGADISDNAQDILFCYLQGPLSAQLRNLLPADAQLLFCQTIGDQVKVELSEDAGKLSGVMLTTACAAMLMTLHDCLNVQTLSVSVKDNLLDDNTEFVISMDDIALMDMLQTNE